MEKENVLEIEIIKIDDNYSYCRIKHQNESILKTDGFDVTFQGNLIFYVKNGTPSFYTAHDISSGYEFGSLRIKGSNNRPFIVNNNEIKYLNELVDLINEKYGIPKRWRAEEGKTYFAIYDGEILSCYDYYDKKDNEIFELGNYFQTEEEARKIINSKEWQDFWAKVRAGEIGGE
jgi:hypothetical protein